MEQILHFQKPKQKQSLSKHYNKKRLSQDQVEVLEKTFITIKKLDPKLKLKLANELKVPPRQIAIWYQNKRTRWKTQTLELDHNTLQVKLDNALAEKRKLEKDVERLQAELKKAKDMLMLDVNCCQTLPPLPCTYCTYSCSASSDEGGSCGFNEDYYNMDYYSWTNQDVLQVDDLYQYLVYTNGSS